LAGDIHIANACSGIPFGFIFSPALDFDWYPLGYSFDCPVYSVVPLTHIGRYIRMKPGQKSRHLISLFLLMIIVTLLFLHEVIRDKIPPGSPDGCALCHETNIDPSASHPVAVMGCAVCHMGNPFARDKTKAHLGLIRNPGSLQVAQKTCGQPQCHPDLPGRVKKSLMATNQGILSVMQNLLPHNDAESVQNVRQLTAQPTGRSMALDHYRKMCGGCHLWRPRYPQLGEIGKRDHG